MKKGILLSTVAALSLVTSNVTANEQLADVDVWETEIISSSLSLGKDVIETRQADHLSDLFRDIPGVDVGGSHSINNKLIVRGVKDEDLHITIDGARMPNVDIFHHMSNLRLNADILKKAKIQVGNNSVVYGDLGGAVEFETKNGKDLLEKGQNFGGIITGSYNSNKSLSGSLTTFGKISDKSDFLLYYKQQDNGNWKDGEGDKTFGVDGDIYNILAKYNYDISDTQSISLSYDRLQDKGDYVPRPDFGSAGNRAISGEATFPTKFIRDTVTFNHDMTIDETTIDTAVYYGEHNIDRYEYINGIIPVAPGVTERDIDAKVKNYGINAKAQSNIETGDTLHTLTYGLLIDRQASEVTNFGAKYGKDEEAKTIAVYLEDSIDFDNGLVVTPGVRFTDYELKGVNDDVNDNKFTYSLGAEYSVNDNLTLLASTTSLYKGVEMVEVLTTSRLGTSNPDIKSETGQNSEIGFRYNIDNFGFSAKYFKTQIKDYIYYDRTLGPINNGDLDIDGIEANIAYNTDDFGALLTYSKTSSNFEKTGQPLEEEGGDKFSLNLNYKVTPEIEASWKSIVVLDEKDVDTALKIDKKQGYGVHDISFKYQPKSVKGLKIIAGIDNIFDNTYASHASETKYFSHPFFGAGDAADYEPGRNIKVTASYKF